MDFRRIVLNQRRYFKSGATMSVKSRKEKLNMLYRWICTNEKLILAALHKDLQKSGFEAYATEVGIVKEEIRFTLEHLEQWAKPRSVPSPLVQFPSRSFILQEPYGVVLIMSPWNYPFQLAVAPLVGAISAGNCAVVKPSAYAPHTARVITKMLTGLFPAHFITVVEGGRQENEELLNQRFDYIFFYRQCRGRKNSHAKSGRSPDSGKSGTGREEPLYRR